MRLMVTGGAGFIGSNFIHLFFKGNSNDHVINADKLTYAGNLENLKDLEKSPGYSFRRVDISDEKSVFETIRNEGVDAIINFAAESHVDRSIIDPGIFIKTNVMGTRVLLDAVREFKVRRFIQVSTDEVYGSLGPTGSFREDHLIKPNSPYSASKASSDLLVRAYFKTYRIPVIITRCSNNFGPYQFPEKLIPLFITNALEDRELPLYGDGLNVRDWIYVDDHNKALIKVLQKGREGEIYNIGGNNERTNIEITRIILRILGKSESLIRLVKDRPGHDKRYAIDCGKIKEELGWENNPHLFEHYIQETIDWYQENHGWWERVKSGEYKEYYNKIYLARK